MGSLRKIYRVDEMARTAGSFGKTMRAALEMARQSGDEFTVKDFMGWLEQSGVENTHPASVGIRLKKLVADEGERPDALHPLIVTQAGRRGPGGTALYKYVFDGPAGAAQKGPEPAPGAAPEEDETGEDDGDTDEPEQTPPPAQQRSVGWPSWLPRANPDGSFDQVSMAKLVNAGFGSDDPIWHEIAKAKDDVGVLNVVRRSLPPQFHRSAIRVAQTIFQNLNKSWEDETDAPPPERQHLPDAPGATSQRPSTTPQGEPHAGVSVRKRTPEPAAPEPEDDDTGEEEEPEQGLMIPKHFFEPEPEQVAQAPKAKAGQSALSKLWRRR